MNQSTVYRNPKPTDVLQGALGLITSFYSRFLFENILGDCWFITALSVLPEEQEYLLKLSLHFSFQSYSIERK